MFEVKNELMFKFTFCDSRNGRRELLVANFKDFCIPHRYAVPNLKSIYFHHVKNAETLNLLLKMTVRTQMMKLRCGLFVFIVVFFVLVDLVGYVL